MKSLLRQPRVACSLLKTPRIGFPARLAVLLALALLTTLCPARAQEADDQYLSIFNVIRRADELSTNHPAVAVAKFKEAESYLYQFESVYPHWHPDVISLRKNYLARRISELSDTNAAPSAPVAAPAGSSALQITLIDAGAEPRAVLRLHPKAGDKQTLGMTVKMAMTTQMGETPMPEMKLPVMKITMETTAKDVAANGDITFQTVFEEATVEDQPEVAPMVAGAMKGTLEKLKGLTATGTMSSRGVNMGMEMQLPADADPQLRQTMSQMKDSLSGMCSPLPDEAVGAGAHWEVKMPIKSQGMTIDQTMDYQVLSIDGDQVTLTNALTQSAVNQKIQNPAMPSLNASLTKMTGSGTASSTLDLAHLLPVAGEVNLHSDMAMAIDMAGQKQNMTMKMDVDMRLEQK
jgi:hypothetical protein